MAEYETEWVELRPKKVATVWVKARAARVCPSVLSSNAMACLCRMLTLIAALRHDRIAPIVFDQPINGETFTAYVERTLIPTLTPGSIVVLDNLGSDKGKTVRQAIRNAGAHLLFLPLYSPDVNSIEQLFSTLKTLLRKANERSVEATLRRIGSLLACFSPDECANQLVNSGYPAT